MRVREAFSRFGSARNRFLAQNYPRMDFLHKITKGWPKKVKLDSEKSEVKFVSSAN
jgi:hypothetical protein